MNIHEARIRAINLDRSNDRWAHVVATFGPCVQRIPAVDGMKWGSGEYDADGRPLWSERPGNVHNGQMAGFELFPTTYGCNLSHLKAIGDFLDSDEEWTIIVEDDTEPVGDLSRIEIPDDADWFYLIGSSHPWARLSIYPDGSVRMSRTLGAYLLNRRAAELALLAMEPMHYFQTDWQIPFRCFESLRGCTVEMPDWPELPYRIRAYGQKESIICHSAHASVSTFTVHGLKPWLSTKMYEGKAK